MKKTYIFKTILGDNEMTLRGSLGSNLMNKLSTEDKVIKITSGSIVTTIVTKIETIEELNELAI